MHEPLDILKESWEADRKSSKNVIVCTQHKLNEISELVTKISLQGRAQGKHK